MGYRVTYLPVQKDGLIDIESTERRAIVTEGEGKTILVSIMFGQ
jgi:cysteine sulfinate desulfinase/cysteine desulfurase-like protein